MVWKIMARNLPFRGIIRVAVGMGISMGIPIGPTCGWEWEKIIAYGNSHMWESYGKSSYPHVGI